MELSTINAPAIDDGCTAALKGVAAKLADRITDFNGRQAELAARAGMLGSSPVETFDIDEIDAVTRNETELLREEITLRREVADVLKSQRAELGQLHDAAFEAHSKAQGSVRKLLAKAGWHDVPLTVADPCKIMPGFISCHPSVMSALARYEELGAQMRCTAAAQANVAGIARCEMRLGHIRRRLLATS